MGHVLPERRMQSMQPRGKAIILTRPVRYPPGTGLAKKRRATAVYVIIRDGTVRFQTGSGTERKFGSYKSLSFGRGTEQVTCRAEGRKFIALHL